LYSNNGTRQTVSSTVSSTVSYSGMQAKVLKMFTDFCIENQRPFCFKDFTNLTHTNFKYFVRELKDSLDVTITGHPTDIAIIKAGFTSFSPYPSKEFYS